jgi:hypothetical protein
MHSPRWFKINFTRDFVDLFWQFYRSFESLFLTVVCIEIGLYLPLLYHQMRLRLCQFLPSAFL